MKRLFLSMVALIMMSLMVQHADAQLIDYNRRKETVPTDTANTSTDKKATYQAAEEKAAPLRRTSYSSYSKTPVKEEIKEEIKELDEKNGL